MDTCSKWPWHRPLENLPGSGFLHFLHRDDEGHSVGWIMRGDGSESWTFDDEAQFWAFVEAHSTADSP